MTRADRALLAGLDERAGAGDHLSAAAAAAIRRLSRRGRKPIEGDDLAVIEIDEMMRNGARSVEHAARYVALARDERHNQTESTVQRLARKYRKMRNCPTK